VAFLLRNHDENDAADRLVAQANRGLRRDHTDMLLSELDRASDVMRTTPHAAFEILTTRLWPRMARCTDRAFLQMCTNQMACILTILGRPEEARPFAAWSVKLSRARYGPASASTLNRIHMHAGLLIDAGRVDEGMAMLTRVLATQTRVLGVDHPDTSTTRRALDQASAAISA